MAFTLIYFSKKITEGLFANHIQTDLFSTTLDRHGKIWNIVFNATFWKFARKKVWPQIIFRQIIDSHDKIEIVFNATFSEFVRKFVRLI